MVTKEIATSDVFDIGDVLADEKGGKVVVIGVHSNQSKMHRKFLYQPVITSVRNAKAGVKIDEAYLNSDAVRNAFNVAGAYIGENGKTLGYTKNLFDYLTGKKDLAYYKHNLLKEVYRSAYLGWDIANSYAVNIFYSEKGSYHNIGEADSYVLGKLPSDVKQIMGNDLDVTEVKDALNFVQFVEKLRFKDKKNTLTALIKAYFLPLYTYAYYEESGKILTEKEVIKRVTEEYKA